MSNTAEVTDGIASESTADEIAALNAAVRRLETRIFEAALKRLRNVVLTVAGILTVFGVASFATIRTAIIDAAAAKLHADGDVRKATASAAAAKVASVEEVVGVVAESKKKLAAVSEVLVDAEQLKGEIAAQREQALLAINADLSDILRMTEQLQNELRRPPRKRPS
jgi:hypothetical protein